MKRRDVLGALGVTAGFAIASPMVFGQEKNQTKKAEGKQQAKEGGSHEQMAKNTAKSCSDCANECEAGYHHCHQQLAAGKKDYARAEHSCVDTATMCYCSAALCARVSPLMGHCCQACAECCDACIAECEKLNDPELARVIEACRRAAKECRQMATMMGGGTATKKRAQD